MEKLWCLKDKIVSCKKLLEIDGVVYRAQDERGEQVHAKLEPSAESPTSAPAERLLAVPELCFAYLSHLATNTKGESSESREIYCDAENLEMRQAITDLYLESRKYKKKISHWRARLKESKRQLNIGVKKRFVYTTQSGGMVPQAELAKNSAEIATWKAAITEATHEFKAAEAIMPTLFYNAYEVRGYFTKMFGYELGHSTLLRYAAEGMPKSGKHVGQRPTALSDMAERDLLKVVRFASDRGVAFKNLEITKIATLMRDVEWKSRQDNKPLPAPLSLTWVQSFRHRMRRGGVPAEAVQNGPDTGNASDKDSSHATKRSADAISGSSSDGGGSQPTPAVVVNLRTAIVELARRNADRQGGVESIREETGVAENSELEEHIQDADDEIAELEEKLEQAKAARDGLRNKADRKTKVAKQKLLLPKRALETERTVLDRVYAELERTPSEVVCGLIGTQIDALQNAPRDEFGAVVETLTGPFVTARPQLETTDEALLSILDEAILLTASRPPISPAKRRKRAEPI